MSWDDNVRPGTCGMGMCGRAGVSCLSTFVLVGSFGCLTATSARIGCCRLIGWLLIHPWKWCGGFRSWLLIHPRNWCGSFGWLLGIRRESDCTGGGNNGGQRCKARRRIKRSRNNGWRIIVGGLGGGRREDISKLEKGGMLAVADW